MQQQQPPPGLVRKIGKFFLIWLITIGLFALCVGAGTFAYLVGDLAIQLFIHIDELGENWRREAEQFISFTFGWSTFMMAIIWFNGLVLYPSTFLLGRLAAQLDRSRFRLIAFWGGYIGVLAAGWYVNLTSLSAIYAGTVSGIVFGAVILPRFVRLTIRTQIDSPASPILSSG
jgi:hypothetical protein